ncbi:hypothetical protein RFI_24725 [Reticulomyxa filosa]|uniref:Uncharacterized protein n=1 Tax=Reticulomyxa filosa TaxID=46433 RepID=X6MFG9_RETFI|nr:hypothetical protein RFI_24725 [Reticulomyxa filosa]|eukprot:ETO12654.1 hypothetical protein RFI_24725 [Reticulomyxa filosa]
MLANFFHKYINNSFPKFFNKKKHNEKPSSLQKALKQLFLFFQHTTNSFLKLKTKFSFLKQPSFCKETKAKQKSKKTDLKKTKKIFPKIEQETKHKTKQKTNDDNPRSVQKKDKK